MWKRHTIRNCSPLKVRSTQPCKQAQHQGLFKVVPLQGQA